MNTIKYLVVHCSDSPWGDDEVITAWHKQRQFRTIGYHYVILNGFRKTTRKPFDPDIDGLVEAGRSIDNDIYINGAERGAHAGGTMNRQSVGICLIGRKKFTSEQFMGLYHLCKYWTNMKPEIQIIGHRDVGNTTKTCPNFDIKALADLVKETSHTTHAKTFLDLMYTEEIKQDPAVAEKMPRR